MKSILMITLLSLAGIANANQRINCVDKKQSVRVILDLINEQQNDVTKIHATSSVGGFWKQASLGRGQVSTTVSNDLDQIYEYQIEGKPAMTVTTDDVKKSDIDYRFTFSKDILGVAFKDRKISGRIDPSSSDGGSYALDLLCSSVGSK